ncbi:DUF6215 domain-containing protein [Streptomyces panaciradicis]|uniref:DUF6215 domain-containing protein n=1 Tax=Streptomyces panaciradicis TaxID=1470261 RepID=UPI00201CB298|nr:DUF6215 domain-containing protein [Streptomyces panaciradicis]MCL6671054.1 DUF6215 domain-containing protein [Streptomyces panaciradicis]
MVDGFADSERAVNKPEKGMSAGAQAVAAVVVVGGLALALWALGGTLDQGPGKSEPATCEAAHDAKTPKSVTGTQLCTALNRPDLPALLGTPDEYAETANGNVSTMTSADGGKTSTPEADVDLKTYSLRLSLSDDDVPVADMAAFLGATAQRRTVLGHPAVLYSDRTIALSFNLGGGKASSGPGGVARSLLVARDAKDGGGFYEVSLWRQDFATPDDAALFRVAEKVLPTVPGWREG